MRLSRSRIVIGCIVAAHAVFAVLLPWLFDRDTEVQAALFVGMGMGQVALLSAWTAIGPGRLVERIPAMVFLAVLLWYLLLIGNAYEGLTLSLTETTLLGILVFGEFVVLQIPFWLVRGFFGWRIERRDKSREPERRGATQFGIGRLLAWTAAIAVVLAAGRWLVPSTYERLIDEELFEAEVQLFIFAVSAFNVIFALPAVWFALRARGRHLFLVVPLAIYVFFLSAAEVGILAAIEGNMDDEFLAIVLRLNIGLSLSVGGTLAALRPLGYSLSSRRWRGEPRAETKADSAGPDDQPSR